MADDGEKREIVVGLPNNHDKLFKIRKPPKPKPKAAEGEEMNVKKKKRKRKAAEGEEMNVKKKKRRRRILKEKVDEGEKGNDDLPEEGEKGNDDLPEEGEVKEGARRSVRTIKPNPKYLQ
ncbi:hypothetical protein OIU77_027821 [Salix suchowensis]|uniref:Uncharacterized protein n=1 Tax=Salix suchowensis TaxID=1278906 RepID=A0ABQ9BR00_9ROSI|nr:hypothetical protein OIU77_027821 [Salix suchowensis]